MFEVPVSWQTGYDGGSPILSVEIDISTSPFPAVPSIPFEVEDRQVFPSGSSGIVTSLAAFTDYTFALYVVNAVGRSDPLVRTVMTLSLRKLVNVYAYKLSFQKQQLHSFFYLRIYPPSHAGLGPPSVTLVADSSTQLTLSWTVRIN